MLIIYFKIYKLQELNNKLQEVTYIFNCRKSHINKELYLNYQIINYIIINYELLINGNTNLI